MKQFKKDKLEVKIFQSREEMGETAASESAEILRKLLSGKEEINCVFAAAPSQNELLKALCKQPGIDWNRVNAFHMDEYVGLDQEHTASFAHFLKNAIFDQLPFKSVNLIHGEADPEQACERYSALLEKFPPDFVFMGIGENGHIAFNDPGVADFHDPKKIKMVKLDQTCRMQQVHDKCFDSLENVPEYAQTVTIPALVEASYICCVVPGEKKKDAVRETINGSVSEKCPATILREQPHAILYLDRESAKELVI